MKILNIQINDSLIVTAFIVIEKNIFIFFLLYVLNWNVTICTQKLNKYNDVVQHCGCGKQYIHSRGNFLPYICILISPATSKCILQKTKFQTNLYILVIQMGVYSYQMKKKIGIQYTIILEDGVLHVLWIIKPCQIFEKVKASNLILEMLRHFENGFLQYNWKLLGPRTFFMFCQTPWRERKCSCKIRITKWQFKETFTFLFYL